MKVLVVSNGCISRNSSNGRTLLNMLLNFKEADILNFFSNTSFFDDSLGINYLNVTDGQALKSFVSLGIKKPNGDFVPPQDNETSSTKKKAGKTCFKMVIRNMVWKSYFWYGKSLKNAIKGFAPDCVLLQVGDLPFQFDFARKIAKQLNIPLIIYSSEDYCLKDYDYIKGVNKKNFWYRVLHSKQYKAAKKAYSFASLNVFNSESLKETISSKFKTKNNIVIYNSSSMSNYNKSSDQIKDVLYAGNIGLGREDSLIEFANALKQVMPEATLNCYGSIANDEALNKINKQENIKYHGVIPYSKLLEVIKNADMLVHAESFDAYRIKDLKYSFSTKIADSLMSGIPFFMYAPDTMAGSQYVKSINPDFFAAAKEELIEKLTKIQNKQTIYSLKREVILANHDAIKCSEQFYNTVKGVLK